MGGAGTMGTDFGVFAVSSYVAVDLTFVAADRFTDVLSDSDDLSFNKDMFA